MKTEEQIQTELERLFQKWANSKKWLCKNCYPPDELLGLMKNAVVEALYDIERSRINLIEAREERNEN